ANASINIRRDAVYQANTNPLVGQGDTGNVFYLFSPFAARRNVDTLLSQLSSIPGLGLAIDGAGRYVFNDYRSDDLSLRDSTEATWAAMFNDVTQNGTPLAVGFGNQYALAGTQRLYDMPTDTSGTSLCDETVPFTQMVVHGSIAYTSTAGNLFFDQQLQKLQWIEFGCEPYYELTYQRASALRYTIYNKLYTSYYGDWIDDAAAVYQEFNTTLAGIWDSQMLSHERVGDIVTVKYACGKTIEINYGSADATVNGQTVPAMDYIVVNS
ncbi:MAG: DUF5696 domain-containing protein, partial [Oscillospiraceae bacterium]|nr:DUF5696 domain-containing protein [Oscillospiraceae bacterium]